MTGLRLAEPDELAVAPRLIEGWPEERYHADRLRLSGSVLELALRNPRAYGAWLAGKKGKPSTVEQHLGSYVHCALLEDRETRQRRFAYAPSRADIGDTSPGAEWRTPDRRTKEGKALWAKFEGSLGGRIPITPEQQRVAERMIRAVGRHEQALALLQRDGLRTEVTGLWTDASGRLMRCRYDGLRDDGLALADVLGMELDTDDLIVELKTDQDPDPTNARNVYRWMGFGYLRKAALYMDGYRAITGRTPAFAFVFVQNGDAEEKPAVCVTVTRYDDVIVELGRNGDGDGTPGYRQGVERAIELEETKDFRAPWEMGVQPLQLPESVARRMEFRRESPAPAADITSRFRGVEGTTR